MATINITINDKGVIDAFNRLQAASRSMTPAMRAIAGILHDRAEQNFAEQRGPDGNEWDKLKPVRNKRRKNPQILVDTGRLKNSISTQAGADYALIGSNVVYAAIHQFGGEIERAAYNGVVRLRARNGRGSLARNKVYPKLAVFARKSHKRVVERSFSAGAFTIRIPARPYLPFVNGKLQAGVEDEIRETIRRFLMQF